MYELSFEPIYSVPLLPLPLPKTDPDATPHSVVLLFISASLPIIALPPIYRYEEPLTTPSPS